MLQFEDMGSLSSLLRGLVESGDISPGFAQDVEVWLIGGGHGVSETLVPDFLGFFKEFNLKPASVLPTASAESTTVTKQIDFEKFSSMSDFDRYHLLLESGEELEVTGL